VQWAEAHDTVVMRVGGLALRSRCVAFGWLLAMASCLVPFMRPSVRRPAVLRSTIVQLSVPDALRGRLSGLRTAPVTGAPRLGNLEANAVAVGFGDTFSVVSGGLGCVVGALAIARLLPGFRHQRAENGSPARCASSGRTRRTDLVGHARDDDAGHEQVSAGEETLGRAGRVRCREGRPQ
jgi:hypothetical protein